MKVSIPVLLATRGAVLILTLFVIFHMLILSTVIPFGAVWGRRLKSVSENGNI